ncbi:MAG: ATP synthase F1 subunit gamma [Candidatus Dormibacteria bacterium]
MATLRDIRRHIRAVRNIEQITRAMQMVAAAKMRRPPARAEAARPYALAMDQAARDVAKIGKEYHHPFLVPKESGPGLLILVTSDRGLAGSLNANTIRAAHSHMLRNFGPRYQVVAIGRKAVDFSRRMPVELVHHRVGLADRFVMAELQPAVDRAAHAYVEGPVSGIVLAYSRFKNLLTQVPTVQQLVPVPPAEPAQGPQTEGDYIYEPDGEAVLERLLPAYLLSQVYHGVVENQASFYGAQMIAMQNASSSAGDVIRELSLTANKVRQAGITKELMEIIGGAEALQAARR